MTIGESWRTLSAIALAICLASCGGGGGGAVGDATTPPPPSPSPPPPPPRSQAVSILLTPATQEFATYASGDALRIRYDAGTGQYEVMASGQPWDRLIDDPESAQADFLLFASAPSSSLGYIHTIGRHDHEAPELQYEYSSLASWSLKVAGRADPLGGSTAFGTPTPAGAVPVTGSATYQGQIDGAASFAATSGWGDFPNAPVGGTVRLDFDFGRGLLAGQIRPVLTCDCDPIVFPTLNFTDTVFGVGSPTFSGRFNTGASGDNSFSGRFTGPNAQELIGRWTFPMPHGGAAHSVSGAWIAKRGN